MVWNRELPNVPLLYSVNLVTTGFSLLGSLGMTYLCLTTRKKTVALKLICAIAMSDFLLSVANVLTAFETEKNNLLCKVEAGLRQFAFTYSIFWVTCTSILCYMTSKSWRAFNQELFFKKAIVIGGCLALAATLMPFYVKNIGYENGFILCYISYTKDVTSATEKVLILALIEGISIIGGSLITLIGYLMAIARVKEASKEFLDDLDINVYRLLWYPIVLFVTFMPCLIDNIVNVYKTTETPLALQVAHLLLSHSIGLTNAVLYGFHRRFYETKDKNNESTIVDEKNNITQSLSKELRDAGFEDF